MTLVALLDHYELMTRLVQQMIERGEIKEPEFVVLCARKQAARFEVERLFGDIEKTTIPIQPKETAPSGPHAMLPSQVEVHEGSWAWVIGTNGKRAGWIDTHQILSCQLYRDQLVDASADL
ncbi:hypothetical protein [Allorhizobium undicola]|uniref:hypothetical protein n=1 Tax=Allorhizobium undicola TaxID=78527 RepID=UPI0004818E48|nr:hypothetical protein [Allorhizobium undicola]